MSDDQTWLVYSREHNAWWRPNAAGYTVDMAQAGRFTKERADSYCDDAAIGRGAYGDAGPPEFAVPDPDRIEQLERELREEQEESEHYIHKLDEMAQQLTEARAEIKQIKDFLRLQGRPSIESDVDGDHVTEHPVRIFDQADLDALTAPAQAQQQESDPMCVDALAEQGPIDPAAFEPDAEREAEQERGGTMTAEHALALYSDSSTWLREQLSRGFKCSCGACHLCAYRFLERAAHQQENEHEG